MVHRVHSASVDPQASSAIGAAVAASTSLVLANPITSRPVAVTTRLNVSTSLGYPTDTYVWSERAQGVSSYVDAAPQTDAQADYASDVAGDPAWEYVSGSPSNSASVLTPAAQYLMYAAMSQNETGQLIDVYA